MIKDILESYGAGKELDNLLEYTKKRFLTKRQNLQDEPSVYFWERLDNINEAIVELNFPIGDNSESYKKAVEQGIFEVKSGLDVDIEIELTPAGKVPVVVTKTREDFERIVQSISHNNQKVDVEKYIGAVMYSGYPNWKRLNEYKNKWKSLNNASDLDWFKEYESLMDKKSLYLDTFIVISPGEYSNVSHEDMALEYNEWLEMSKKLRRYHEVAHYYTKRVFGSSENNAFDEIIADFIAIVKVFGEYDPKVALRFLGLEEYPRLDGRLEYYVRGNSSNFISVINNLVFDAINNISRIYDGRPAYEALDLIAKFTLPEIAAKPSLLQKEFEK